MSTLDTHPDFDELISVTAQRIGILPIFVRKDYWVTRILRAISNDPQLRSQVIFKGGTSLSKGWLLIDRFSEDIDLLTTGSNFSDLPEKKTCEQIFKAIKKRIEHETPLQLPDLHSKTPDEKTFLYARFSYHCNIRYPLPDTPIHKGSPFSDYVFLEMGFRGGKHPHLTVSLNSFIGETILALGQSQLLTLAPYKSDFLPFELELLDPTRTFVEKLLAIHCALAKGIHTVRTRHYYDIASIFTKSKTVRDALQTNEFPNLVKDAIEITIRYFDESLDPHLKLNDSPALNLAPAQIKALETQYANEEQYYFQGQPPFKELMDTIAEIRQILQKHQVAV